MYRAIHPIQPPPGYTRYRFAPDSCFFCVHLARFFSLLPGEELRYFLTPIMMAGKSMGPKHKLAPDTFVSYRGGSLSLLAELLTLLGFYCY